MKNILITGGAGFIGYNLARDILNKNDDIFVISVDNMNDYYEISLKRDRINQLTAYENFKFIEMDISSKEIDDLFKKYKFDHVVNLAAQAGVRYAKEDPDSYITSNINGFYNIVEVAAKYKVKSFIYASSSSVYGANDKLPYKETDHTGTPMSLYAATKISNEALASAYHYTHGLRTIGLRFFNVYGPWGRPDMAYFKWATLLLENKVIELRDSGNMWRDMTYISDVTESINRLMNTEQNNNKPYVYNIGNQEPVKISDVLNYLSRKLEKQARIKNIPRGLEEPVKTWANTDSLEKVIDFVPQTDYQSGLDTFIDWYRGYYL